MRRFNICTGYRSEKWRFFTEGQVLKFVERRDQDTLTNLVFSKPDSHATPPLIEVLTNTEPAERVDKAIGAVG
jgi:hypothetical protein